MATLPLKDPTQEIIRAEMMKIHTQQVRLTMKLATSKGPAHIATLIKIKHCQSAMIVLQGISNTQACGA